MAMRRGRKKNTPSRTCICDLPDPITRDILSRLPVNSIAHSKCVCKNWRDLVSDPFFAKLHLSRSTKSVSLLYPYPYDFLSGKNIYIVDEQIKGGRLYYRNSILGRFNINNFPIRDLNVVCSCNGMLLCLSRTGKTVYVCNPIKGSEWVLLPDPAIKVPPTDFKYANYGFGYCPRSDKYKVIRMVTTGSLQNDRVVRFEILLLGNKEWRYIGAAPFSQSTRDPFDNQIASPWTPLNGSLHLLVVSKEGPLGGKAFIFCFKMYEEKLSVLAPGPVPVSTFCSFTLGLLESCLAVLHAPDDTSGIDIWVMNDYGVNASWTRKWHIADSILKGLKSIWLKPIKYTEDGKLLMSYSCQGYNYPSTLVSYDPDSNKLRKHKLHNIEYHEQIDYVPTFLSPSDLVKERNNNRADLSGPSKSVLELNSKEHI